MVNTDKLRGLMAEKRYSQTQVAKMLGISGVTMCKRMKTGIFMSNEIDTLIDILDIKNPEEIFFSKG